MIGTMAMVALAAVLWGANFNLAGPVVAELHPLAGATGRFALAALVLLGLAAWRRERVPLVRHAGTYAALGIIGIAGFNVPFFYAMETGSAVNGALIMATNPLVTALLSALLVHERLTRAQRLALPLALAGVAAVVLGGGATLRLGSADALILFANLCWAAYNVLGRWAMPPASGLANTAAIMTMGAVALGAVTLAAGAPLALPGPKAGAALLVMAVGGSALAYLFWNAGLARLGAARTALFLNLVPVATMVIAAAGGTWPGPAQLIGGAVVLAAVSLALWPVRPRPPVERPDMPKIGAFALSPSEKLRCRP